MGRKGKKYRDSVQKVERQKKYNCEEAVQLALDCAYGKFDENVDLAVRLGVDPRHADQMVRGTVVLPNGVGKDVRVAVFAKGEKEKEALEAGADQIIIYGEEDFEEVVLSCTDGEGVDVVYESVGQATFEKSLDCLKPRGYLVLFGQELFGAYFGDGRT